MESTRMTTQEIVAAIQKQANRLDSIETNLCSDHQYYRDILSGNTDFLSNESLILLGAYLATRNLLKAAQKDFDIRFLASLPPDQLADVIRQHFGG